MRFGDIAHTCRSETQASVNFSSLIRMNSCTHGRPLPRTSQACLIWSRIRNTAGQSKCQDVTNNYLLGSETPCGCALQLKSRRLVRTTTLTRGLPCRRLGLLGSGKWPPTDTAARLTRSTSTSNIFPVPLNISRTWKVSMEGECQTRQSRVATGAAKAATWTSMWTRATIL